MADVLLIENDTGVTRLLALALESAGYSVETVATGRDGLNRFDAVQPDLVILDACLPDRSGYEICADLRQRTDAPVLMLTGRAHDQDIARGMNAGADDFLIRPVSSRVLLARTSALLERSRRLGDRSSLPEDRPTNASRTGSSKMAGGTIEVTHEGGWTVLAPQGSVTRVVAETLRTIHHELSSAGHSRFVIDFWLVRYLGSSALRAVSDVVKQASQRGATVRICRVPPHLSQALQASELGSLVELYESRAKALRTEIGSECD